MQRKAIFVRVNRDGADAHFGCGAHDADGDFATICDEDAADKFHADRVVLRKEFAVASILFFGPFGSRHAVCGKAMVRFTHPDGRLAEPHCLNAAMQR